MLLMVLGNHVFCLCGLRHSGPCHNCHSPDGRSFSLTRGPDGHSGSLTRGPDGCSCSLTRGSYGRSGSLTRGRSRPRKGCCPKSSCRRSCGQSRSESRPSRCRRYQHCQGGKYTNCFLFNDFNRPCCSAIDSVFTRKLFTWNSYLNVP